MLIHSQKLHQWSKTLRYRVRTALVSLQRGIQIAERMEHLRVLIAKLLLIIRPPAAPTPVKVRRKRKRIQLDENADPMPNIPVKRQTDSTVLFRPHLSLILTKLFL